MTKEKKIRLNLDVSLKFYATLQKLKESTGSASIAEVVRRAVSLYQIVNKAEAQGWRVGLQKEHGETEILKFL